MMDGIRACFPPPFPLTTRSRFFDIEVLACHRAHESPRVCAKEKRVDHEVSRSSRAMSYDALSRLRPPHSCFHHLLLPPSQR